MAGFFQILNGRHLLRMEQSSLIWMTRTVRMT